MAKSTSFVSLSGSKERENVPSDTFSILHVISLLLFMVCGLFCLAVCRTGLFLSTENSFLPK